ncbi:MAG: hypothetical protein ACRD1R_16230 [Acidobacteriota bacterium]
MLVLSASWSLAGSSRSIVLEWNKNLEADVVGYNVYRSDYAQAEHTHLNETLVTDTTALSGQRYSYVVTAVNSGGLESSFSNNVVANLVCLCRSSRKDGKKQSCPIWLRQAGIDHFGGRISQLEGQFILVQGSIGELQVPPHWD